MFGSQSRPLRRLAAAVLSVSLFCLLFYQFRNSEESAAWTSKNLSAAATTTSVSLVLVSQSTDDMTWTSLLPTNWQKHIYVADNTSAPLHPPQNKGGEGMSYLTHIIDSYASLSDITIFHHAARYQWHNDDPAFDSANLLNHLQLPYIFERGYINLRCTWIFGCPPDAIRPFSKRDPPSRLPGGLPMADGSNARPDYAPIYKKTLETLFPGEPVPKEIRTPCCAQFAVSKAAIRKRSLAEYERMRQWLVETELEDDMSGRVVEYLWHSESFLPYCRPRLSY